MDPQMNMFRLPAYPVGVHPSEMLRIYKADSRVFSFGFLPGEGTASSGGYRPLMKMGTYGGKAVWLARLNPRHLPRTTVVPLKIFMGWNDEMIETYVGYTLWRRILVLMLDDGSVILRSSAAAEDGSTSAMAGHFESHAATKETFFSTFVRVASRYAPHGSVVIQPLLRGQYSAIVFGMQPDGSNGYTMEWTVGGCGTLTDGTGIPELVRGTWDTPPKNVPPEVTELWALAYKTHMETLPGLRLDMELIYALDRPWIVQARPITTERL